jgi:hypothetical protein
MAANIIGKPTGFSAEGQMTESEFNWWSVGISLLILITVVGLLGALCKRYYAEIIAVVVMGVACLAVLGAFN